MFATEAHRGDRDQCEHRSPEHVPDERCGLAPARQRPDGGCGKQHQAKTEEG